MDEVFRFVRSRSAGLAQHPLMTWLREAPVDPAQRLLVLPVLAPFALGYPSVCTQALRPAARDDDLARAIRVHARAAAAHARLFLADWDALGLDGHLGWQAGDLLWWLWLAPDTASVRAAWARMLALPAADGGDPLLRCAWLETARACAGVFFAAAGPLALEHSARTGLARRYPSSACHAPGGPGYAQAGAVFQAQRFGRWRREEATGLAAEVCGIFGTVFDAILEYGAAYPAARQVPQRPRPAPPAASAWPLPHRQRQGRPVNTAAQCLLDARRARTAHHPLWQWLSSSPEAETAGRLAVLLPQWAPGVMGHAGVLQLLHPTTPPAAEAGAGRAWAERLAGRDAAFLSDWDTLGVDQRLGWAARDMLHWLYVDPRTDLHRRCLATVTQLAASHVTPLARMWLLEALETSRGACTAAAADAVWRAERALQAPLAFFSGRWDSPAPNGGGFRQQPLSPDEHTQVLAIVSAVFDAVDSQLDLDLSAAQARLDRPVPPQARETAGDIRPGAVPLS